MLVEVEVADELEDFDVELVVDVVVVVQGGSETAFL